MTQLHTILDTHQAVMRVRALGVTFRASEDSARTSLHVPGRLAGLRASLASCTSRRWGRDRVVRRAHHRALSASVGG
eukprot:13391503-Alexandrium_andersonii.AAC.1